MKWRENKLEMFIKPNKLLFELLFQQILIFPAKEFVHVHWLLTILYIYSTWINTWYNGLGSIQMWNNSIICIKIWPLDHFQLKKNEFNAQYVTFIFNKLIFCISCSLSWGVQIRSVNERIFSIFVYVFNCSLATIYK